MKNDMKYNVGDIVLYEVFEKKVGIIKEIYKTIDANKEEYLLMICGPTNQMKPFDIWVRQKEIVEKLYSANNNQ